MKNINQIYTDYDLLPALQLHQLRVASVAQMICEHFSGSVDSKNVIIACLVHDMGNIIKSDLKRFPEFLEPEGIDYWRSIKDEFIKKYGSDEHEATRAIANEIAIPEITLSYLNTIGFSNMKNTFDSSSFEIKICSYADMRVGPHGVLSLEDRIAEARKRYEGRKHAISSENFEVLAGAAKEIENQIFSNTNITPNDITDKKIEGIIQTLREIEIA